MSEPSQSRPVPGPSRPGPRAGDAGPTAAGGEDPFAGLTTRPVAEHVEVFEAEHARLERELGTIDQV